MTRKWHAGQCENCFFMVAQLILENLEPEHAPTRAKVVCTAASAKTGKPIARRMVGVSERKCRQFKPFITIGE